jgi:hypothetical protein
LNNVPDDYDGDANFGAGECCPACGDPLSGHICEACGEPTACDENYCEDCEADQDDESDEEDDENG